MLEHAVDLERASWLQSLKFNVSLREAFWDAFLGRCIGTHWDELGRAGVQRDALGCIEVQCDGV